MSGFLLYISFRMVKYFVICSLCLVYVEAGPGGEYVGNIIETMVAEFSNVNWSSIFTSIKDNLVMIYERLSESDAIKSDGYSGENYE